MPFFSNAGKALADVIPGLGKFTFDADLGTVFITSGTGVIGYRVALSLLEAGHQSVRVGVWYGDRDVGAESGKEPCFAQKCAETLAAKGAEIVNFDWSDDASHKEALSGVKTIFCTIPHMENWSDVFPSFLKIAKDKKVEHFIKVSFLRKGSAAERYRSQVHFVEFHGTCDDLLEQAPNSSRISYTILCASHLMSTPLVHQGDYLRKDHKFVTASYGMGVNYVSPNDVADAALVVLMDRKTHRNKVYNLSGPGPITDRQVSRLLGDFFGSPINHVEMGYHDFKKDVAKRGLPDWLVRDSAEFEKMKASGVDELSSSYSADLEKIIGKKPESFKVYLANKNAMRPGES